MSHTAAPWQLCTSGSNLQSGGYVLTEYFVCTADSDIAIAADIVDPKTGEPSKANARLIAAAPDLLAALECLVGAIEYTPLGVHALTKLTIAQEAIAKARGESCNTF